MKTKLFLLLVIFLVTGTTSIAFQEKQDHKVLFEKAKYTMETKGDLNGAINLFNDIIKKYPKEREYAAKSQLYIGLCYEKLGAKEAQKAYQKVVNTYPDQTEMVTLARAKLTLYNSATAGTTLKAEQSFKLAADLFKQLKYEAAVVEYEKVINLTPNSQMAQEAQLWIGHCYFKQGKNEQALKSFNTIVKDYPGSNLVPVAELMISQVKQAIGKGSPNRRTAIVLDDKTILDTVTGIKFTKINSWAGKKDVVKAASSITDISSNRKFLLAGKMVVPFDNSDSFTLNDSLYTYSKLSPDGTQVAFFSKNAISVLPFSPVTGRPTGPAQKILDIQYQYGYGINWSPNGNNLIFSLNTEPWKNSIWTFSTLDRSLKQISNTYELRVADAVYAKSGSNFLYKHYVGGPVYEIRMKSLDGKSVSILDSCAGGGKNFLSPDNKWIMYTNSRDKKLLYRMSDKQQMELTTPLEVGDFVSWADKENKVFSFCSSSVDNDAVKVASVFGGPVFELEKLKRAAIVGWAPNSGSALVCKGDAGKQSLLKVNLTNQDTISLDGIDNIYGYPSLSPDGTKVLALLNSQGKNDLSIVPVSLKDGKITGKPIQIFKTFTGMAGLDFSWSPDGKSFAVCNQGEVYICSAEGGTPSQLTKTSVIENYPNWSPDGNAISVFIRSTNQLRILKATDGEVLMTQEKVESWDWTPDGKDILIAFKDGQLNVVSITTGKSRKIANWKEMSQSVGLNDLIYSPDGKKIIIDGYQNAPAYKTHTFLFNVADGKISEVAANYDENIECFTWSPDSKWISYVSYGKKRDRLESTLWEADLTDFMKKMKPGTGKGYTTDFDFKTLDIPIPAAPDGTFTDPRDSHVYKYKKIGAQTWMAENLNTDRFRNGDIIPEAKTEEDWLRAVKEGTSAWCYYDNDPEKGKKYGKLYNWYTLNDKRGLAPEGWHIPTKAEFETLIASVNNNANALKAIGEGDGDGTNTSGFSALMAGCRSVYGGFFVSSIRTFFGSSDEDHSNINTMVINNEFSNTILHSDSKGGGFSVRCVKK